MENLKVKALFFAQYLTQNLLYKQGYNNCLGAPEWYIRQTYENGFDENDNWYLLLRTVDQLTDEEIKNIADVCDFVPLDEMVIERNDMFIKVYSKYQEQPNYNHVAIYLSGEMFSYVDSKVHTMDNERCNIMWQLLRAYGVLTSLTYLNENGKPQTLQPDEIIANGWAKTQQP